MPKQYIKSISIEGFRGINNENNPLKLDFKINGITSVFAPNGIGKSSIFDALSYCLNDELKCLKLLQHDNKDYKTIQNVFHNGIGLITIELQDSTGNENIIEFTIDENGGKEIISSNKSALQRIIDETKDIHNFLDYSAFADILYSNQENAGKTFLKLIGYESFSAIQDNLTSLARTQNLNTDFKIESKKQELNNNIEIIDVLKETIFENLKSVGLKNKKFNVKIISNSALKGIKKLIETEEVLFSKIDISKAIEEVNNRNDGFNELKIKLSALVQENQKLVVFSKNLKFFSETKYNVLVNKLKRSFKILGDVKNKYLGELYEKAISLYDEFQDIDKNTCVLCDTDNLGKTNRTFVQSLEIKIKKFNSFFEKYNSFKIQFKELADKSQLINVEDTLKLQSIITKKTITDFYYNNRIVSVEQFENDKYLELIESYKTELLKLIAEKDETVNEIKEKIPEELHKVITKLTHYITIQDSLKQIIELEKSNKELKNHIKKAEEWVQFIVTVKDKFVKKNNNLIKEISNDITLNTQLFFQEIMMSPEIIPKIEKKDIGQKVLMLLEKFYSIEGKKAATLLSESNRNALCLSIYFACALNKSKSGFLVLDDITSSFDSGHQRNLLTLIKNKISRIANSKGKQVILLTHDGELEKSLKSYSSELSAKWSHYTLSKESNIKVDTKPINTSDIGTILKARASNGENIGNEIRKYFEKIVLDIHKNVKIPMPFDLANYRDKRMLNNMLTNIRVMLKLHRSAPEFQVINTLPSDSELSDIIVLEKDIANIISHYESDDSASYSPSFIIGIINKIEIFNEKFQYNCNCVEVNGGMTYFAKLNSKKVKNCKCSL